MSEFNEKIKLLIEQRIIEATKKQITQKVLSVAKTLGKPIISQSLFSRDLDDPWHLENDNIYDPSIDIHDPEDYYMVQHGYYFDGLRYGINLCIAVMMADKVGEIKVTHNGYVVFAEVEGDIKCYVPYASWEDALNMFYEGAQKKERELSEKNREKRKAEGKKMMGEFWNKFKNMWGY